MNKIFWLDLETTGVLPGINGIIQLAALIELDGKVEEELNLLMRPMKKHTVEPEALTVNKTTEAQITAYPHPADQFAILENTLNRYVNRFEKLDKFILAGYNVSAFDEPFLRQFFVDNAATREDRAKGGYFGSWFFWPKRDVQTYLSEHIAEHSLRLPNYRLATICEHFNIPIEAHDAMSDIKATRTLYQVLRYSIST